MATNTQQKKASSTIPAQTSPETVPVFTRKEAPPHLRTVTQLKAERLKVGPDQQPHARMRVYRRGHGGWTEVPLYHPDEAEKMRPLSTRQQAQKLARRTCAGCGHVHDRPLNPDDFPRYWPGKPEKHCTACLEALYEEWSHTCQDCATRYRETQLDGRPCDGCRDRRQRAWAVVNRLLRRHCPTCLVQTATQGEVDAAGGHVATEYPRACAPCKAAEKARREEIRRAEERERWDELGPVRQWARRVVAAPHEYAVLDTETTGLESDAAVVEISITDGAGTVLLDTLVHPGRPIPEQATAIHGISDDDVREAPSFGAILPQITAALRGRRVIIYQQQFDTGVLAYELERYHQTHAPTLPGADAHSGAGRHPAAVEWMDAQQWELCAMLAYAVHVGEWSDYWDGWSWHKLHGGHRALGDCRAVVERIKEMAESPDLF
ncbi:exonuclease domain-containing protein [Streptomyces sp. NPDC087850]|uniref:3'-5' exonuclease n=1 Tax=Streptomyces sp. NPDC087850 TaxID=3365809 RepID=UPI0037FF6DAB